MSDHVIRGESCNAFQNWIYRKNYDSTNNKLNLRSTIDLGTNKSFFSFLFPAFFVECAT